METDCRCGSGATYVVCCGPLHSGTATASTPVQLMRSRYSAFAVREAGYLLATWHPATRPASVDLDPAVGWRRLRVRGVTGGTEDDDAGTVEFVAHYWDLVRRYEGGRRGCNITFFTWGPSAASSTGGPPWCDVSVRFAKRG
jgi:SEC-C motif-containing protein